MGTPLGSLSNCSKERTVSCTQMFLKLSKRCRQHTQCVCRHNKGKNKLMHKGYVYSINRSVNQTVCWLCEQNLYHSNGRIPLIDFIHFGTYAFWFYTFCQLYIYTLWTYTFWNYIFCRAPTLHLCSRCYLVYLISLCIDFLTKVHEIP